MDPLQLSKVKCPSCQFIWYVPILSIEPIKIEVTCDHCGKPFVLQRGEKTVI